MFAGAGTIAKLGQEGHTRLHARPCANRVLARSPPRTWRWCSWRRSLGCGRVGHNLKRRMVLQVADALREQGIPFVFASGDDEAAVPEACKGVPRRGTPVRPEDIAVSIKLDRALRKRSELWQVGTNRREPAPPFLLPHCLATPTLSPPSKRKAVEAATKEALEAALDRHSLPGRIRGEPCAGLATVAKPARVLSRLSRRDAQSAPSARRPSPEDVGNSPPGIRGVGCR
jgi:hypothetical protein